MVYAIQPFEFTTESYQVDQTIPTTIVPLTTTLETIETENVKLSNPSSHPVPLYAIDGDTLDRLFSRYISNVLKDKVEENDETEIVLDVRQLNNATNTRTLTKTFHEPGKSIISLKGSHSHVIINGNVVQYVYNGNNGVRCDHSPIVNGNITDAIGKLPKVFPDWQLTTQTIRPTSSTTPSTNNNNEQFDQTIESNQIIPITSSIRRWFTISTTAKPLAWSNWTKNVLKTIEESQLISASKVKYGKMDYNRSNTFMENDEKQSLPIKLDNNTKIDHQSITQTSNPITTLKPPSKITEKPNKEKEIPINMITRFPSPIVSWYRNNRTTNSSSTKPTIKYDRFKSFTTPTTTTTRKSRTTTTTRRTPLSLEEMMQIKRKFFDDRRMFVQKILSIPPPLTTIRPTRRPMQLFPSFAKWINTNFGPPTSFLL